jgi:hypothetical protein
MANLGYLFMLYKLQKFCQLATNPLFLSPIGTIQKPENIFCDGNCRDQKAA